jgi:hypothetical protein
MPRSTNERVTQIQTEDHHVRLILELHPARLILEQFPVRLVLELQPLEDLMKELETLKHLLKNEIESSAQYHRHLDLQLYLVRYLLYHPEFLEQCLELGRLLESLALDD